MTETTYFLLVAGFAAVCGALTARIISYETRGGLAALFAGSYCGAGAGLAGAPPFAFLLTFFTDSWAIDNGLSALTAAVESTGLAVMWGILGGAAGGAVVGLAVAVLRMIGVLSKPPDVAV